jgi:acyl-CoA thioester hydrolase
LEKADYFLPVLSCSSAFHSPAFFDDRLQVIVKIEKLPLVRIEAFYEVKRKDGIIATGITKHAFVSSQGRVVRPPSDFVELARAKFTG